MATNLSLPLSEGEAFEKQYFEAFPGIKAYFNKVKKEAWERGYILISKLTGHKAYIYDWEELKRAEKILYSEGFWDTYKRYKELYHPELNWQGYPKEAKKSFIKQIFTEFSKGTPVGIIAMQEFTYVANKKAKTPKTFTFRPTKACVYCECVKHYFKRKSTSEKQALNYPVQGSSAQITKLATIKYFNHLLQEGLLFKVKIVNEVHDEIEVECPDELVQREAKMLQECMESAGAVFCKSVKLRAVPEIGKHWIH